MTIADVLIGALFLVAVLGIGVAVGAELAARRDAANQSGPVMTINIPLRAPLPDWPREGDELVLRPRQEQKR